ncbi:MAG: aspartyl-phosphate phosphatase Spo0E family protein [Eubacteriales bacterium]|nr:aspartyl-phosphate phosphatase Spo0E family protein [Eubacteriales bacterium]MDD3198815.1 aspartyl-phosphate phosphatase Spo0E family protein [Eubacteriales bacterium]MDD4122174.1 aspartyl-phosphate phosphatase Spo0E family protein [Eubacteriales bacterium]MDD4629766.1 aspartyl-phosphate phosphatase Spo0E family protein [Eubacteriales bacterium]
MTEIEYLLDDIEKLRKTLNDLIAEKGSNLQDPEIIAASQVLNAAITKYTEVISKNVNE